MTRNELTLAIADIARTIAARTGEYIDSVFWDLRRGDSDGATPVEAARALCLSAELAALGAPALAERRAQARTRYMDVDAMREHLYVDPSDYGFCLRVARSPAFRHGLSADETAAVAAWLGDRRAVGAELAAMHASRVVVEAIAA